MSKFLDYTGLQHYHEKIDNKKADLVDKSLDDTYRLVYQDGWRASSYTVGATVTVTSYSTTVYGHKFVVGDEIQIGDKVTVYGKSGTSTTRLAYFVNSAGILKTVATSGQDYTSTPIVLTIEENGTLYVNAVRNYTRQIIIERKVNPATLFHKTMGNPFVGKDPVGVGNTLALASTRVRKNTTLSAHIQGTVESVSIGVGYDSSEAPYRYYGAAWAELTPTTITFYSYTTSQSTIGTYNHGLILTDDTTFVVVSSWDGQSMSYVAKLHDGKGNIFSQEIPSWGAGPAFLTNNNSSDSITAKLSFMPRDLQKSVWLFGDSYVSFGDAKRWPYYFAEEGLLNWLQNSQSGVAAGASMKDLMALLSTNVHPKLIVWTLGMNGAIDSNGSVNEDWLYTTRSLISICSYYNIELVISTIPTVPNRVHTALNSWVRNSGVRYIDFAAAVENGTDNYWKGWGTDAAMLYSDEIHPTAFGAKALAAQAFADCPELTLLD